MRAVKQSSKPRGSARRTRHFVLAVAFLVILYLPLIGMVFGSRGPQSRGAWQASENRPFPSLSWRLSSVLGFPKAFGQYFQYHFGFRRNLIRWHTKLVGDALGKSTSHEVIEGKDGWLFLGQTANIEDYRGMFPFSHRELRRWQTALESRRDWLAQQDIHYLFVICPDKHTVYSEYMPDKVNRVRTQTRLDQLVQHMREHSSLDIVDLRPALAATKRRHVCYQPQESHWNGIGAFAGYQQIALRLRAWYPNLRILDFNDCEIFQEQNTETDLLRLQGKDNLITIADNVRPIGGFAAQITRDPDNRDGEVYRAMHSVRADAPLGRLLMLHDSFAPLLMPLLAEHFREGVFLWTDDDDLLPREVRDFKPDVVIEELVERRLCTVELDPLPTADPGSE